MIPLFFTVLLFILLSWLQVILHQFCQQLYRLGRLSGDNSFQGKKKKKVLFTYARHLIKINHELQKINRCKAMTMPGVLPEVVVLLNNISPKKHYQTIAIFKTSLALSNKTKGKKANTGSNCSAQPAFSDTQ